MKRNVLGEKFGKLTILEIVKAFDNKGHTINRAKCLCECGNTSTPPLSNVTTGTTTSCGCMRRKGFYARNSFHKKEMKMILERQRASK